VRVVAILQARMNSSRLPGKSLLPLLGTPMVQHIVERVQRAKRVHEVVLAFPRADLDAFSFLSRTCTLYPYWGDENDLVGRYLGAANAFRADIVVRVPCDNPCVDPAYVDQCIEKYMAWPNVFVSNAGDAEVGVRIVDGLGCEVFSFSRLKWLDANTEGMPRYREHPHLLFHHHQEPSTWSEMRSFIRLDVNTQSDYDFIKSIYDHFQRNDFTAEEIVAYLDSKTVKA